MKEPLPLIVKNIRKYKKTSEYIDEDGRKRCSKVPIVGKAKLLEMLLDWQNGLAVDKVALKHKLSYNRLKKAFNTLGDHHK